MSAATCFREPLVGSIGVLLNALAHEVQLAQRILRRVDFLRGCTFQQFSRFYRVQYQQPTVTVRRADDVLCVCIFCIC